MTDQLAHYRDKLAFETDSWDLFEALRNGEFVVVIDRRSEQAYAREHLPRAVSLPHRSINKTSAAGFDRDPAAVALRR